LFILAIQGEITGINPMHRVGNFSRKFDTNFIFAREELVFGVQAQLIIRLMRIDSVDIDLDIPMFFIPLDNRGSFNFEAFLVLVRNAPV
jgi:hypothetical protein